MPRYHGRLVVFEQYRVTADTPEAAQAIFVDRQSKHFATDCVVGWEISEEQPDGTPGPVILDHGYAPISVETMMEPNDADETVSILCRDCGRSLFYDHRVEQYRHLDEPDRGCFLIAAEAR